MWPLCLLDLLYIEPLRVGRELAHLGNFWDHRPASAAVPYVVAASAYVFCGLFLQAVPPAVARELLMLRGHLSAAALPSPGLPVSLYLPQASWELVQGFIQAGGLKRKCLDVDAHFLHLARKPSSRPIE